MIMAQGGHIELYYSYKVYVYVAWSISLLVKRTSNEDVIVDSGQNLVLVAYFLLPVLGVDKSRVHFRKETEQLYGGQTG